jgi:hypothetical protein
MAQLGDFPAQDPIAAAVSLYDPPEQIKEV